MIGVTILMHIVARDKRVRDGTECEIVNRGGAT